MLVIYDRIGLLVNFKSASQGGTSTLQVYWETKELELLKMCAAQSGGLIFWWRGGKWLQHHFILG